MPSPSAACPRFAPQGMQPNQQVTFITDGGEDVRDLPPRRRRSGQGGNDATATMRASGMLSSATRPMHHSAQLANQGGVVGMFSPRGDTRARARLGGPRRRPTQGVRFPPDYARAKNAAGVASLSCR